MFLNFFQLFAREACWEGRRDFSNQVFSSVLITVIGWGSVNKLQFDFVSKGVLSNVLSLSHPASCEAKINLKVASPNESIWGILLLLQLEIFLCLMNSAMHSREHEMLQASLCKNSFMLKREIGPKWPSQRLGSDGTFASYGRTEGVIGSVDGSGCSAALDAVSLWTGGCSRLLSGEVKGMPVVSGFDISMSILLLMMAILSA